MIKTSKPKKERRLRENSILSAAIQDSQHRDSSFRILGRCIACLEGIPLLNGGMGTGRIDDYNHVIPRSRLPGESNFNILHNPRNLVGTCRAHHMDYDCKPEFWLPLMMKYHGYIYTDRLWVYYLGIAKEKGWLKDE